MGCRDNEICQAINVGLADRVYTYLLGLTGNAHLAEDLIQELWVSLLEKRRMNPKQTIENFECYLFTAARNKAFSAGAQQIVKSKKEKGWRDFQSSLMPIESTLAAREEAGALMRALDTLSPRDREIVLLKILSGLGFRSISNVIGISKSTVYERYARALVVLRGELCMEPKSKAKSAIR